MIEDDVQLIRKVLSGDDEAFTKLVRKHQKSVHALAWRKVGDFHAAEEIMQDVFLLAYKRLPKLKDPKRFSGWLYTTTNQLCQAWLQKNKPTLTSLEDVPVSEIERTSYEQYISAQHEEDTHTYHQELVKRLLEKLPESERTVMTLYYLGEMTAKEIGNFLGMSVNTVTSRLQRARQRLEQHEELLVQETLESVQLPESLTLQIDQKIIDTNEPFFSVGKLGLPSVRSGAVTFLGTLPQRLWQGVIARLVEKGRISKQLSLRAKAEKDEISKRFDVLAVREDNWDGYNSEKPTESTLSHAKSVIEKLVDTVILAGLQWHRPFISSDEDGYITAEWHEERRELHIQIGENEAEYIQIWGTNIDTKIHMDSLTIDNYQEVWRWLIDEQ